MKKSAKKQTKKALYVFNQENQKDGFSDAHSLEQCLKYAKEDMYEGDDTLVVYELVPRYRVTYAEIRVDKI